MRRSPRRVLAIAGFAALALTTPAFPATAAAVHPTARVCAQTAKPGMATCFAERQTDTMRAALAPNALPSGFGPSGLRSAYNLTASGSASATVAIVDAYDDPNAESDLATYRSTYGLPACTTANGCFKKVNQNGQTSPLPTADSGWAGEISLDVDMVSAICPSCHILLVEASQPSMADLGTAVNTAVSLGAKYVSNSYGGGEDGSEPSYDSSYFHHPGVAITASTGDSGYGIRLPGLLAIRHRRRRDLAHPGRRHPRLDRNRVERRGQRLLDQCGEAGVPERYDGMQQARQRRRLRGRRPADRRRGLQDLRRQRLGRLRRHQRLRPDHRLGLRTGRHPWLLRHARRVSLLPQRKPLRRDLRQQRQLLGDRAVQGGRGLGRPDRARHPQG
ncbi:hypothetical protein [Amycolatopsis plumensis]|uniref:hypothetical protein n=1 Tax=Amycolatopsis plumensis TaxID=236508 RepID=UPI00361666EA